MRWIAATLAFLIVMTAISVAQTQAGQKPKLGVVSIKRNSSGQQGSPMSLAGGRFVANNATLTSLITSTHRSVNGKPLLPSQIVGLPSWATRDHFDIQAMAEGEARTLPDEEIWGMVDTMLQDRFQLRSHRETREEQIFILTVSKPGRIKLSADQSPPSFRRTPRIS